MWKYVVWRYQRAVGVYQADPHSLFSLRAAPYAYVSTPTDGGVYDNLGMRKLQQTPRRCRRTPLQLVAQSQAVSRCSVRKREPSRRASGYRRILGAWIVVPQLRSLNGNTLNGGAGKA